MPVDRLRVAALPERTKSPAEDDKMVVTVRLPYVLRISRHAEIPVVDRLRQAAGCGSPELMVPVPIDRVADEDVFEIEKAESVFGDRVRAAPQACGPAGHERIRQIAHPRTGNNVRRAKTGVRSPVAGEQSVPEIRHKPQRDPDPIGDVLARRSKNATQRRVGACGWRPSPLLRRASLVELAGAIAPSYPPHESCTRD